MDERINNSSPKPEDGEAKGEDTRFAEGCKYCTRCGRRLPLDAAYCDGCGHMQGAKQRDAVVFENRKSYRPEKISDIIGKERSYYNEKFKIIQESGNKACFNWYACLGWFWFMYRKMPVEAAVCFGAYCILGMIPAAGRILQLVLLACCGSFGNYIYLRHIERTIDKIDMMPAGLRQNAVKEYGGVSGILLIIAFLIWALTAGGLGITEALFAFNKKPIWYIRHIF